MATNIPLPAAPSPELGSPLMAGFRRGNALREQEFNNVIRQAQARYAPWTEYANAASKIAYANLTPYQIQAQIASNPLLWMALKDKPEALNALMKNLGTSIPSPEKIMVNANMPPAPGAIGGSPGQAGEGSGLFGLLQGVLSGGLGNLFSGSPSQSSQVTNALTTPPIPGQEPGAIGTSGEGVLINPASKGSMAGVSGKMEAPYVQQPYEPGRVATIDGETVSIPANANVSDVQRAYVGVENSIPILKDISKGADEFLSKGGKKGILASQIDGLIQQWGGFDLIPDKVKKSLGIDSAMLSRYADWKSNIQKAPEGLMNAFFLPQNELSLTKMSAIVDPIAGETAEGYKKRINNEIHSLENVRLPFYKQFLGKGVPLASSNKPSSPAKQAVKQGGQKFQSQMIKMRGIDPNDGKEKLWDVPQGQAQIYLDAGFKRVA